MGVPALYGEAFGLYLIEALAAGVPVVTMLAWGSNGRHSFLVTQELSGARTLAEYLDEVARVPGARPIFMARFAAFLRRLLTAGVRHPDLHAGNVLVAGDAMDPHLVLVDVYGVVTDRHSAASEQQIRALAVSILGVTHAAADYGVVASVTLELERVTHRGNDND